jgi:ATP-dependent DNA ligase
MPLFSHATPPPPSADPADWRPQRFGRGGGHSMRDPIIEPSWSGVRVLARLTEGRVTFRDEDGADCTAEFGEIAAAIAAAALAGEFILDGFLTVEPTQITAGVPTQEIDAPTPGQMMSQWIVGNRIGRAQAAPRRLDPNRPIAFVAVDLLEIDGTRLLDVPLLERKRLLDGSVRQDELVRVTPFVRPPIDSFVATWRGLGFRAMVYKGANSRYVPDAPNKDWSIVAMPMR